MFLTSIQTNHLGGVMVCFPQVLQIHGWVFSGVCVALSIFFLCNVLQIVVFPFVLFLLAIVLSVLLRFTDYDCSFGIFKFSLQYLRFLLCDISIYTIAKLGPFIVFIHNDKRLSRRLEMIILYGSADKYHRKPIICTSNMHNGFFFQNKLFLGCFNQTFYGEKPDAVY